MSDVPARADVVVVGGGVMGASTAYHLVRAGVRNVVLLEREAFFGLGATGRCAGGIRHQFGTEINIRLSIHSLRMLDDLEAETGQPALVRKCGYLFVLTQPDDVAAFQRNVALQHALGVPTEWLSGDDVRQRLPQCAFPDALGGTYLAADGLADPNSVVSAYINAARRGGAQCLTDVVVTGLDTQGGRITAVQTSAGRIAAGAVVNAAGPWSAPLAGMAGVNLPVQPLRRQWLTTTGLPGLGPSFPFVIDLRRACTFIPRARACSPACQTQARRPASIRASTRTGSWCIWRRPRSACRCSNRLGWPRAGRGCMRSRPTPTQSLARRRWTAFTWSPASRATALCTDPSAAY